jgi:biotin transport system ATP-binding protein
MPLPPPRAEGIVIATGAVVLGGRQALGPLDLQLTERRVAVIGRNGSGKTTLLRLIAGLVAPVSGQVTVEGADLWRDRKAALRHIGILFQNPDHQILFPTVDEELAFGLRQQGRSKAEAEAAVAALLQAEGRAHWAGLSTQALSQGQKQHLCLMAVLLMQPGTLLLDEPFAALDLPTQARLSRRLEALPQRLITISHDPRGLLACDRVLWLEGGALAGDGRPEVVLPAFQAEMDRLGRAEEC